MKIIRWVLGRIILFIDFLTRPSPIGRDQKTQHELDSITSNFSLYQFNACPFCVKVRRTIRRYSLNIELRDAKNNDDFKKELTNKVRSHKVPCLRIQSNDKSSTWLYGSEEIIFFLKDELKLA